MAWAQDHFGLVISVHPRRGLQPVPDEEVIDLYGGTQHIPLYQMSGFYGKVLTPSADAQSSQLSDPAVDAASLEGGAHILVGSPDPQTACLHSCPKTDSEPLVSRADGGTGGVAESVVPPQGPSIKQFMDIFSLPEMALLSCVVDHFLGHGLEFDQAHLYKDVTVRTLGLPPRATGSVKSSHSGAGPPGSTVLSLSPNCPQDAIRDVHVKGLMYQWIEQDMGKRGQTPCCGLPEQGTGLALTYPSPPH